MQHIRLIIRTHSGPNPHEVLDGLYFNEPPVAGDTICTSVAPLRCFTVIRRIHYPGNGPSSKDCSFDLLVDEICL